MKNLFKISFIAALCCTNIIAQDIEIYESSLLAGDDTNPNILFVVDNSNSMLNNVAVAFADYDPNTDYGNSNDDSVYIYDDNLNFLNVRYPRDQVACNGVNERLTPGAVLPLYNDSFLQWREARGNGVDDAPADCLISSAATAVDFSANVGTGRGSFNVTVANLANSNPNTPFVAASGPTLEPGTSIGFTVNNTGQQTARALWQAIYQLPGGRFRAASFCTENVILGQTQSCIRSVDDLPRTISVNGAPLDVVSIRLRIETTGTDLETGAELRTDVNGSYSYNIGAGDPIPGCAVTPAGHFNWFANVNSPTSGNDLLECQGDEGVHGATDSAANTYVRFCNNNSCADGADPNYRLIGPNLDWTQEGSDTLFVASANFHDYLQNANAIPGGIVASREDFCDDDNTEGVFFTDSEDNIVYQCQQKIEIVTRAARDLADNLEDVNVGLMRFQDWSAGTPARVNQDGGSIVVGVRDINAVVNGKSQREVFKDAFNLDQTSVGDFPTFTPLFETQLEAHLYFSGQPPIFGQDSITDPGAITRPIRTGNARYQSPIENACQSNNIVFLTDGIPFLDSDERGRTRLGQIGATVPGFNPDACGAPDTQAFNTPRNCFDELATVMSSYDHLQSGVLTEGEPNHTVNTFTVGFDVDLPLLAAAASGGNGQYFLAEDYLTLQIALNNAISGISAIPTAALIAPAVSVNTFNELEHRDEVYYSVFQPSTSPRWNGNVKKYRITDGVVTDARPAPAVNDATGFFDDSARSFWSATPDGRNVTAGGAREQLTNNRRIFVDAQSLANGGNGVVPLQAGDVLSLQSTGAADAAEARFIRDWLRGADVADFDGDLNVIEPHNYVAHSLHGSPFIVTYGGTEDNPIDVLFFPTNQGMLHAINPADASGAERWAYVPENLMGHQKQYIDNDPTSDHVYGFDGPSTLYTKEADTSTAANFQLETVNIFQAMRRGGRDYYAWDVSNALGTNNGAPISEMWRISGGVGDFADLGQSWSRMSQQTLSWGCNSDSGSQGCTSRDVLVFSGGYDERYDDPEVQAETGPSNTVGNAIYIVDRDTGALIWSAGEGGAGSQHNLQLPMYNSIPAAPTPIDIDGDGDLDMIFAIDISGKIWRIDFDDTAASPVAAGYSQGGMIADVGQNLARGMTRFFNELDVSLASSPALPALESNYLAIVVGSGYRAHPKEPESSNAIFVIYDDNVFSPLDENNDGVNEYGYNAGQPIRLGDLFNATNATILRDGLGDDELGFFRSLTGSGEKLLQSTSTVAGRVFFATYLPDAGNNVQDPNQCGVVNLGGAAAGVIDLATGELIFSQTLNQDGIPATPVFILNDGFNVCFGAECTNGSEIKETDGDLGTLEPDCDNPLTLADAACFNPGEAVRMFWREN